MAAIEVRHQKTCRTRHGGTRCNCAPSYRAAVWSPRDKKRVRKTFPTLGAAKQWRVDAEAAVGKGAMRAGKKTTLREAWEEWILAARAGVVRNRSGDKYKPGVLRGYAASMRLHVLEELGGLALSDLRRADLQQLIDELVASGRKGSTVRNTLNPVRAVCRRAIERDELSVNPTANIRLPAVRCKEVSVVTPDVAGRMIDALPTSDRAVWSTAFYAGLRAGELQALSWSNIDLATGVIDVQQGWDKVEGAQEPKTRKSRRRVPIVPALRDELVEHRLRTDRSSGLVFGRSESSPFAHWALLERAKRAWEKAGFDYVTLHGARHTFASLLIAAGEDPKKVQAYMGHSSITVTFDRYGHLMPGSEEETAGRLHEYLTRSNTAARLEQLEAEN